MRRRRSRSGRQHPHPLAYPGLAVLAAFAVLPLVVLGFNSAKNSSELGSNPLGPPSDPSFGNLGDAWAAGEFATTLLNSALLAAATGLGVTVIASLTAYALTRMQTRGSKGLLFYILVCTAVPAQLFIVPLFFLWTDLALTNTLFGLIVIYWAVFSPFATLLLRSYLLTIPRDFDEAGRIEGASERQILTRIILPLARPGLLVVALTTALFALERVLLRVHVHPGRGAQAGVDELLGLSQRVRDELGPDQRRRTDHDRAAAAALPRAATAIHRRTDDGRPEGVNRPATTELEGRHGERTHG